VDVVITGPAVLEVGASALFLCSARCSPPCSFTWTFGGFTAPGGALDVTVNGGAAAASIGCRAENTFSGRTAAVNRTLAISGTARGGFTPRSFNSRRLTRCSSSSLLLVFRASLVRMLTTGGTSLGSRRRASCLTSVTLNQIKRLRHDAVCWSDNFLGF